MTRDERPPSAEAALAAEVAALESDLVTQPVPIDDVELRRRLARVGDLFLDMVGRDAGGSRLDGSALSRGEMPG